MENNKKRNSYKVVTILIVSLLLSTFTNVMAATPTVNPSLGILPVSDTYGYNEEWYSYGVYSGLLYTSSDYAISISTYVRHYGGTINNPVYYGYVVNSYNSNYVYMVCATLNDGDENIGAAGVSVSHNESNDTYSSENTMGAFENLTSSGYSNYFGIRNYIRNAANLNGNFYRNSVDSSIVYDSFSDFMDDIVNYQAPVESYSLNYSLPAGNAIVIELGQGSNPYTISTTSINPGPFDGTGLDGKQWGFYNSLPSTIEYPLSGASDIAFRGYGGQSVFGQYMTYSISGDFVLENHTEQYLIIVNPLWAYTSDGNITNSRIDISIDKVTSFKVYPLGTQLVNGGWTSQNEGEYLDGNYDESTNTWYTTDEDGNVVESQVGGYNYVDYGPQTVTQWLENIAHQISGFFTGAIGAITTLVSAIGNIATELHGLYVWLPPAVQGILTSALILAITIGVIKVFI